ncbi:MAG: Holliday junction resolvase RuvX [Anaerolineaceae bacterium]
MVESQRSSAGDPNRRILAVDPGDKCIGLALSDRGARIGRPLIVLTHVSRILDAASIAGIAKENKVTLIVVGQALDGNGQPGPAARKAARLAEAIQAQTDTQVILWDESGSTGAARETLIELGVPRSRRRGHQDALAAVMILKDYLEALDDRSNHES